MSITINKRYIRITSESWMFLTVQLWFILQVLQMTFLSFYCESIIMIGDIVLLGMLLLQIVFFQRYIGRKIIIILCTISIIIIISTVLSHTRNMMSLWLFIMASNNLDFDIVIKKISKTLIIMISITIMMFFLDIIPELAILRHGTNHARHSLGFLHPNGLGFIFFLLVVCQLYIHRNNLRIRHYVIAVMLGFFVYIVPNSKSACISVFLIAFLFLLFTSLLKKNENIIHGISIILIFMSIISNLFSVYFGISGISYDIIDTIDEFLSLRISGAHYTYLYNGITFWGQYVIRDVEAIIKFGHKLNTDNAYMLLIMRYGIVVYILFSLSYYYCMIVMVKRKRYLLVMVLAIFAIYGITENYVFMLSYNIFLFNMSNLLYIPNKTRYQTAND